MIRSRLYFVCILAFFYNPINLQQDTDNECPYKCMPITMQQLASNIKELIIISLLCLQLCLTYELTTKIHGLYGTIKFYGKVYNQTLLPSGHTM